MDFDIATKAVLFENLDSQKESNYCKLADSTGTYRKYESGYINCTYNSKSFTVKDIKMFTKKFPEEIVHIKKLHEICTSTIDQCGLDFKGNPIKKCLLYKSKNTSDPFIHYCKVWIDKNVSKSELNKKIQKFCDDNKNIEQCKCINASMYQSYNVNKDKLKNFNNFCWFKPCRVVENLRFRKSKQYNCDYDAISKTEGLEKNDDLLIFEKPKVKKNYNFYIGIVVIFILFLFLFDKSI